MDSSNDHSLQNQQKVTKSTQEQQKQREIINLALPLVKQTEIRIETTSKMIPKSNFTVSTTSQSSMTTPTTTTTTTSQSSTTSTSTTSSTSLHSESNQQFSKSLTQTEEHSQQQIQTEAKPTDENIKYFSDSEKEIVVDAIGNSQNQLQSVSSAVQSQETTSHRSQNEVFTLDTELKNATHSETETIQTSQQIQETESHPKIEIKTDINSKIENSKESSSSENLNQRSTPLSISDKSLKTPSDARHPSRTQLKHKSEVSRHHKHKRKDDDIHKNVTEEGDSKTFGTRQHETNGKIRLPSLLKTKSLTVSHSHSLLT
jgi:hypothetical protein